MATQGTKRVARIPCGFIFIQVLDFTLTLISSLLDPKSLVSLLTTSTDVRNPLLYKCAIVRALGGIKELGPFNSSILKVTFDYSPPHSSQCLNLKHIRHLANCFMGIVRWHKDSMRHGSFTLDLSDSYFGEYWEETANMTIRMYNGVFLNTLSASIQPDMLQTLNLSRTQLGLNGETRSAGALATIIRVSKSLTNLNLAFNTLGYVGYPKRRQIFETLVHGLESNTSILTLNLEDNMLATQMHGEYIKEWLNQNQTLTELNIRNNREGTSTDSDDSLADGLRGTDNRTLKLLHSTMKQSAGFVRMVEQNKVGMLGPRQMHPCRPQSDEDESDEDESDEDESDEDASDEDESDEDTGE